jgi:hypothetical protein
MCIVPLLEQESTKKTQKCNALVSFQRLPKSHFAQDLWRLRCSVVAVDYYKGVVGAEGFSGKIIICLPAMA